jgi:hypothetical protein
MWPTAASSASIRASELAWNFSARPGTRRAALVFNRAHREAIMRTLLLIATATAFVLAAGSEPSRAEITYPWCAQYGGWDGGGRNCGFSTYEQCRATVSGIGGYCETNPMYRPSAEIPPASRRHRR